MQSLRPACLTHLPATEAANFSEAHYLCQKSGTIPGPASSQSWDKIEHSSRIETFWKEQSPGRSPRACSSLLIWDGLHERDRSGAQVWPSSLYWASPLQGDPMSLSRKSLFRSPCSYHHFPFSLQHSGLVLFEDMETRDWRLKRPQILSFLASQAWLVQQFWTDLNALPAAPLQLPSTGL